MRDRTLTVSQLNEYVKGVFEDELVLHNLCVVGEVYEYKQSSSATFVTLRENDSILSCVAFGFTGDIKSGDKVSLFGSVKFYARSGKVSFVFTAAQKVGSGPYTAAFNELKEKLRAEGIFDRKKHIKAPIVKVAVITSASGAVIHDFVKTVHRRYAFTDIVVYSSGVQGKNAASEIADCLKEAGKSDCDVIVIARGGGGNDDLETFNDETLVRAVADCALPIISAVGHETDFTLCDFASSVRAGTPSMAGEYISRLNEDFCDRIAYAANKIDESVNIAYNRHIAALNTAANEISHSSTLKFERIRADVSRLATRIEHGSVYCEESARRRVISVADTLSAKTERILSEKRSRTELTAAKLDGNNPLRILSAGYAKLTDKAGNAAEYGNIRVGDELNALLADGKITAEVLCKQPRQNRRNQWNSKTN